ncbi:related to BNR/Asp-box repeat domain protein [Rhynchosporium agropyri]|uniref:Related to BNR/Asp-box repeat domain protein n=1 Tax=Rhynchosporium agropyri TaxID=914238 RepID=A0A1E1KW10_9HELO|nr:related to BNR/Asp-box repeat domain protein [Rhynchosporium agropyri]
MLLLSSVLPLLFSYQVVAAADTNAHPPKPFGHFINNTIHQPTGGEAYIYPRHVELPDGTVIATCNIIGQTGLAYFPIFESKDGGANWQHISNVTDQVNGWGLVAHPSLTQLTEDIGDFKAGTILATGLSWSTDNTTGATKFDLYASQDRARSWKYVSHIATGGRPNTVNGATSIWEPFLLPYKGQLVIYYSDQRDPLHGQKVAHQTSSDLINWGPVVNDVTYELYTTRPGMPVVAYIPPIDEWILVHEKAIGGNSSEFGVTYPVYYVMAKSPLEFGKSVGRPIVVNGTRPLNSAPYVVWSPEGGPNGTIIVSDSAHPSVFTNSFGGAFDRWQEHDTPAGTAHSRPLQLLKKHPDNLLIYGAETWNGVHNPTKRPFSITSVSLHETLKKPAKEQEV